MPFQSEKQRRYLWANEPEIARDWTDTYGSGIAKALGGRIGYQDGTLTKQQIAMIKDMQSKGMDTSTIETITGATAGQINSVINAPAEQEVEGTSRLQENEKLANLLYNTQGLYGDKINEEGLMKLMKGDPLADSYGLTNNMDLIKSFAQDPNLPEDLLERAESLQEKRGTMGYTYPHGDDESIYIRDLNKFTNQPDINNPNTMGNIYETNKRIADVIGHERRHRLLDQPRFADIKEQYESALPQIWEGPYTQSKQEEIFNRIMDLKSGQLRGQLEGDESGLGQMKGDYRDMHWLDQTLAGTENIPMMGTGFNVMQKLDPIANEFIQRAKSGITSAAPVQGPRPHQGMVPPAQYGIGQVQDDDDDDTQSWWRKAFSPQSLMKKAFSPQSLMKGAGSYLANKAGLGILGGPITMGLSMLFGGKGGFKGQTINPATKQFMQNYGVGVDPQTGRQIGGPFAGQNRPGMSMFGSKTPQEMALRQLEKYRETAPKEKVKTWENIAAGQNGGVNGGTGGGMGKGQDPGGGTAGSPFNRGGLAALWPR